jgi:hypothetical protein
MNQSASIINLSTALLMFHKAMGKIAKTSSNPFFKSQYADLPSILDAIKDPLHDAGLVIVSIPDGEGLTTLLIHSETGEHISANAIMKPVKNDPQSMGSAITYQRRYSIGSILNLNIDKDDDGNAATGLSEKKQVESIEKILERAKKETKSCTSISELTMVWNRYPQLHQEGGEFESQVKLMKLNITKNNK